MSSPVKHEHGHRYDLPPAPSAPTTIDLFSTQASTITNVNLYTNSRAEITRLFKLTLSNAGAHQLNITGLPRAMDRESLRVESRGAAKPMIHDVWISTLVPPSPSSTSTSPLLSSLQSKETKTQKSLKRVQNSLSSLSTYISSLRVSGFDASRLKDVIKEQDAIACELDEKVLLLEEELEVTRKAIKEEYQRLSQPGILDTTLHTKATIVIFAESAGEIEIVLIYAVRNATWSPRYDIRVSTSTSANPTKPVTLIYKALISQSTGESWNDVPLTLHTSAPTFGADVRVPTLHPWTVYVYRPEIHGSLESSKKRRSSMMMLNSSALVGDADFGAGGQGEYTYLPGGGGGDQYAIPPPPPPPPLPELKHRGLQVSSAKGGVSATFSVPGLITVPSDGDTDVNGKADTASHNVTITTLDLDAKMGWVCVPKKDTRIHLKAKIKNASEYTLLPGPASVYVDGSFISKSDVPLVSPEEKFECPLGLDPSIRVTYHPRTKTVTRGSSNLKFYASNTTRHAFTQRITVHNTKAPSSDSGSSPSSNNNNDINEINAENNKNDKEGFKSGTSSKSNSSVNLKVIDQFPVSEDSTIRVKILQPPLVLPSESTGGGEKGNTKNNKQGIAGAGAVGGVTVSPSVTARWDWDGADEDDDEDDEASARANSNGHSPAANVNQLKGITETSGIGRDGRFLWDCTIPPQGRVGLTMQWEVVVPSGANIDGL